MSSCYYIVDDSTCKVLEIRKTFDQKYLIEYADKSKTPRFEYVDEDTFFSVPANCKMMDIPIK